MIWGTVMYTIRDATSAFFKLDGAAPDEASALDKSLRNLSQRIYLPPTGRKGRADTFSLETICALRLLYKASAFGLDRWQLEKLAQFLQIADPVRGGRSEKISGAIRLLSPVEEAVRRVRDGETFNIGVAMLSDGTVQPFTDWPSEDDGKGATFLEEAGMKRLPEDARFTLPASRLIGELIDELEALN